MVKIFSIIEANEWLRDHGAARPGELRRGHPRAFRIEGEPPGRCMALARAITLICRFPALLWIDEIGIWDSTEELPLIGCLRASISDTSRLEDVPARLFEAEDRSILFDFLSLTLYFAWGAVLYDSDSARDWIISHDGFIWISGEEVGIVTEGVEMLRRYGFAEVGK